VIIILVIAYLLYTNFLSKPPAAGIDIIPAEGEDSELPQDPGSRLGVPSQISSPKLKTDLLNDPRFTDLVIFGDLPVEVGEVGRDNPFVPYDGYNKEAAEKENADDANDEDEGDESTDEDEGPPEGSGA